MSDTTRGLPGLRGWVFILAIFAGAVFLATALGRLGTRSGNLGAASTIAVGTAILAAMAWRYSRLPRWALATSVAVLAVTAVGSAWLWPDAATWRHSIEDSLWMHPWYYLTLVTAGSGRRALCGCSPQTTGWLLVAGAVALAIVVPVIAILT